MEKKIIVCCAIIVAGTYILSRSWSMTIGVALLLYALDAYLTAWVKKKDEQYYGKKKKEEDGETHSEDGTTVIGVVGTSRDENHAFVYLAEHFEQRQLPVPHILAQSADGLRYLQTDLGSTSLFDAIRGGREAGGRYNQHEKQLLKATIRQLPNIQIRGARGLDWQNCYPQPEFDEDSSSTSTTSSIAS